jgi:hypothetical protein
MGALIQTKGTRLLVSFLGNQFGGGNAAAVNLAWLRQQAQPGGSLPDLINDFAVAPTVGSPNQANQLAFSSQFLYDLSEKYATLGPNSTPVFYPLAPPFSGSLQTSSGTAAGAGQRTLNFTSAPNVPYWVSSGMTVTDATHPAAIQAGTTVQSTTSTTVTITLDVAAPGISAGDNITFAYANHGNLLKRWRYFLQHELKAQFHDEIRSAILQALTDTTINHIQFDAIEDVTQSVNVATEHNLVSQGGQLDPRSKHIKIVLLTLPTRAPDPVDPQF